MLFARCIATDLCINGSYDPIKAYKEAYPDADNERYIKERTTKLLKTETISKMIDKQIDEILNEEGATHSFLIKKYKTLADGGETDNAKLKALDSLAKISGLFDLREKKSEQVTIWAGFTPEQLEEVKKNGEPELIAHAEEDAKEENN